MTDKAHSIAKPQLSSKGWNYPHVRNGTDKKKEWLSFGVNHFRAMILSQPPQKSFRNNTNPSVASPCYQLCNCTLETDLSPNWKLSIILPYRLFSQLTIPTSKDILIIYYIYIYTCLHKFCFSNRKSICILLLYFHQKGVDRWRPIIKGNYNYLKEVWLAKN